MPVAVAKPLTSAKSREAVQAKCVRRRSVKTEASPREESSRGGRQAKGLSRGSANEDSTRSGGHRRGPRRASLAGRQATLKESITSTSSQTKQFASLGASESRFFHVARASIIGQHHIDLAQVRAAHGRARALCWVKGASTRSEGPRICTRMQGSALEPGSSTTPRRSVARRR